MNLSNYYCARYHCYCCCVHCPRRNEDLVSRKCRSSRDPATARQQRPCFVRGQKLTAKKLAAGLARRSAAHLPKSRALSAATSGTLGGCRDQGRATPTLRADSAHQFQGSARSTWGMANNMEEAPDCNAEHCHMPVLSGGIRWKIHPTTANSGSQHIWSRSFRSYTRPAWTSSNRGE